MKDKIIKIEVSKESDESDFFNFLEYNQEHIQTKKRLVKKENNFYWFVTIKLKVIDQNKYNSKSCEADFILLDREYEIQIKNYINNNPFSERLKNCLNTNIEELEFVKNINDFKHIKGIGKISIIKYQSYLLGLLKIKKNYNTIK